ALFVSAEQAYLHGLPGLFWFLVPNFLCLILFIPFAKRIRRYMPKGYTLSSYMGKQHSVRVKGIYIFPLSMLSLLSTVVQLLAGSKILSLMTGVPFWIMTLALGLFAFAYSVGRGIKASVFTDGIQMILIILACLLFVPWALFENGVGTLA